MAPCRRGRRWIQSTKLRNQLKGPGIHLLLALLTRVVSDANQEAGRVCFRVLDSLKIYRVRCISSLTWYKTTFTRLIRLVTTQEVSETGRKYLAAPAPWSRDDVTCMHRSRRCKLLATHRNIGGRTDLLFEGGCFATEDVGGGGDAFIFEKRMFAAQASRHEHFR